MDFGFLDFGLNNLRDFQEINYPNKRTTEAQRTQRGEIERIFASVLEYFFIWKSLKPQIPNLRGRGHQGRKLMS
ncbi:hypothetical protein CK516_14975 [Nostoc sp. 'Peltigera malacea cyanobiont' DB3992]|nr:hypothetical protein CK516_14975 [Nostoc sp. 'Peltigera malacea cyanobiont' DB3992]